jgi:hypothetical protein
MLLSVRTPRLIMSRRRNQIGGDFRQSLDRLAVHVERTRRISSACEMG